MDKRALTSELKAAARQLGFQLSGVCPAMAPPGDDRFRAWLAAGYAGQMHYLADRAAAYAHPHSVLEGARSVLMVGMSYRREAPQPAEPGQGRVSRYAWGSADYHDLIHSRLQELGARLIARRPAARVRGIVDTAPLREREFAQLAGLGWIGKNTLLLNRRLGSWFFLAALLTDQELAHDAPFSADHCGTCRACLDACPTQAFVAPYVLDARRCISYLTIELRTSIPHDLRRGVGEWLFGCDACQDVCPWNRRAAESDERKFSRRPAGDPLALCRLFACSDAEFRAEFRATPLWRAKRRGLLRNAATVLGNQRSTEAVPALARGLHDVEPLVREACAWALGRIGGAAAGEALRRALATEPDALVREALAAAHRKTDGPPAPGQTNDYSGSEP